MVNLYQVQLIQIAHVTFNLILKIEIAADKIYICILSQSIKSVIKRAKKILVFNKGQE